MKIGYNKLRLTSGEVRTFKSQKARDAYEHYATTIKRGWKPKKK